ncbi:MAG: hypothetical protein HY877_02960 [Deltaproteobacteria bacterium]|nr:hypothetical protein [Deltaproteobacteria bacterium]
MALPSVQIVGFETMPLAMQIEMVANALAEFVPAAGDSGIVVSDGAVPLLEQWKAATDAYQHGTLPTDQLRTRMMEMIQNHRALYAEIIRRSGSSASPTATRFSRTPPTAALLARATQTVFPAAPRNLVDGERIVWQTIRKFLEDMHGEMASVPTSGALFKQYIKDGKFPERGNDRLALIKTLSKIVDRHFLRYHLGGWVLGEYWKPKTFNDFKNITTAQIKEWFDVLGVPETICVQFLIQGGVFYSFQPILLSEDNKDRHYARLHLRRTAEGKYEVFTAAGHGGQKAVQALRDSEAAKSGALFIRNDGFLGLKSLRLGDLDELRLADIDDWFDAVAKRNGGKRPKEIDLQYMPSSGDILNNVVPFVAGGANKERHYGLVRIRQWGKERYEITRVEGDGKNSVSKRLREIPLVKSGSLTVRSDGFLGLRPLEMTDFERELTFISPTDKEKRFWFIEELGLQVLEMGENDFEIMEAGGLPPDTPAEMLVDMLDGLIRGMTGKVIQLWHRRGIELDYEETRFLMRAALPLFLKKTKWNPQRNNLFLFIRKYFYFFFERKFLKQNNTLLKAHVTARIIGVRHASYLDPQRAAKAELKRRHLLPYNPTAKEADSGMTPVWERAGLQNVLDPEQEEQLTLAVGHSIYLFLRNPSVSQEQKEAFLLRYRGRKILKAIGVVVGASRETVRLNEKAAMEIWRFYLKDALEEAEIPEIFIRHCLETPDAMEGLRDSLSLDELAKVMRAADFDSERWKFLAEQMPEVIPPF